MDTGDALVGGGPWGDMTQGEIIVAGMNQMGYDAMALGPKELALGADVLRQRLEESEFAMLSANVVFSGTDELVAQPFTILEMGGHRLGIIGLTRPSGEPMRDFQVLDPQPMLARYVSELAEQADTVIVLTNLDYRSGLALAGAVPGIDLLIAALPSQLPSQAVRAAGTGTIVVTAEQALPRHAGRRVGRLVVTVEAEGALSGESWTSVPMDRTLADDLVMQVLLDQYRR